MIVTVAINLVVIAYESREAGRLASEVLLADAMQTRGDVWSSVTVMFALAGARAGLPILDPLAALVVAGFIGHAGFQIARPDRDPERSDRDSRRPSLERGHVRSRRAVMPQHPRARIARPRVP